MLTLFTVLALLAAVAAVVLAFIFILPEKKRESLGKFGKLLHDTLNFKFLVIEKVLQALYIFATAFVIVYGFLMLFYVQSNPFASINRWYGGYGIMLMLLGPIVIRVIYELMMLAVLLVKNVISINNKLKSQNDEEQKEDVFAIPDLNQYKSEPAAPVSAVLALGGGTLTKEECANLVMEKTFCVYLRASTETLVENLRGAEEGRPMLAGGSLEDKVKELLAKRESLYEDTARAIIDTDGQTYGETAEAVIAALASLE